MEKTYVNIILYRSDILTPWPALPACRMPSCTQTLQCVVTGRVQTELQGQ